jgi:hypothetical protein
VTVRHYNHRGGRRNGARRGGGGHVAGTGMLWHRNAPPTRTWIEIRVNRVSVPRQGGRRFLAKQGELALGTYLARSWVNWCRARSWHRMVRVAAVQATFRLPSDKRS